MLAKLSWKNANLESVLSEKIDIIAQEYQGVMVGWSAGLDSTALFEILRTFLKQKKNFSLAVCHMNFGLRGDESEEDMRFVEARCAHFGIECRIRRAPEKDTDMRESTQVWARRLRRDWFRELAVEGWAIGLAHHKNDVAETAIMRLARGSGVGRLAGMSVWDKPFFRPLLHLSREQLKHWVVEQKLQHREDSSNAKLEYSRNQVRHQVLPVLDQISANAASKIADAAFQGREVEAWATGLLPVRSGAVDLDWFLSVPHGVQLLTLRYMARKKGLVSVKSSVWTELLRQLAGTQNCRVRVDLEWDVVVTKGSLFLVKTGLSL